MAKRLAISLFLLLLGLGLPARADNVPPLNISVDRGVPLTLSAPAASVFIANPEVADIQVMSPTSVMVFGKRTGETSLVATGSNGRTLLHRTIVVEQDLTDLRKELGAAIPDHKIEVRALPDGIVLTGEARESAAVNDAQKIAQRYVSKEGIIINRVRVVGSNQIQIRVRFAEMSHNVDKSFGINWEMLSSLGGFAFGIATGSPVFPVGATASGSTLLGVVRPNNTSLALPNNVVSVAHRGGRFDVNGLIDALAQDGLVTVLAEPNLTAMSGETASFLAGGEFPIPIPQANGTISIEYKHYGVSLSFTPTLTGEDRINLHIKPEVSQLTDVGSIKLNNIAIPALSTRKAETTVELSSGQSFAIAGLLNNSQDQTVNKYPFLGDLPILGPLFRSTQFQNSQSELVIIITPYVVRPGATTQAMALPTDGFSPPSEAERILGMRYSSGDPDARPVSGAPQAIRMQPQPPAGAAGTAPAEPAAAQPAAKGVPNNLTIGRVPAGRRSEAQDAGEAPAPAAAPIAPVSVSPAAVSAGGFLVE